MYQLDPVGRLTLTSSEVSRQAAQRHAHLEALATPKASPTPARRRPRLRPQEWLRVMVLPAFA